MLVLFGLAATLTACKGCKKDRIEKEAKEAQASVEQQKVSILRFDQDLFSANALSSGLGELQQKYGEFWPLFYRNIINVARKNDPHVADSVKKFTSDRYIKELQAEVTTKYKDVSALEAQFSGAWTKFRYYFPQKPLPAVISFMSGFNYAVISTDSSLAIGLDMYLGSDYKYYPSLGLPMYRIRRMTRDHIVPDAIHGWAESEWPLEEKPGTSLLSHIIYQGKLLYFTKAMLPELADTLLYGYTQKQVLWSAENESNIWAHFLSKKLLYTTNYKEYFKYISDGPTTNGLPREAPSYLASWVGYQIVTQFMEANQEYTLAMLMKETDEQKVLKLSNYRPKK